MQITREIKNTTLAEWLQAVPEEELAELRSEREANRDLAAEMDARLAHDPQFVTAEQYLTATNKDA